MSYGVPGEFQIVRCLDCHHLYTNPRPTADTVLNCYPSDYGPHSVEAIQPTPAIPVSIAAASTGSNSTATEPWYLSPAARRIPGLRSLYYWLTNDFSNYIPKGLRPGSRILELGCATGTFLLKLRDLGYDVHGVEPVASAASEAKKRGLEVHAGTLESADLPHESFDVVFAWMVMEHLLNPRETLLELRQRLRPDGFLVFSVPNAGCWEPKFFGKKWFAYELPRHLHHYTPRRLTSLLQECGYERIKIIHQRNLLTVVRSFGIVVASWIPKSRLAQRLIDWTDHPTLWGQLALAPFAIALSGLRQGGRLTVVARKGAINRANPENFGVSSNVSGVSESR